MAELTLVGLRVVQAVATHGSFTAAADALGYTQSAVSRQVAAMERATGTVLFERLARGVRPTAAGRILVRHGAVALERADAASLELRGLQDRLEGRLAVGAFPSALGVLVPRAVALLAREHPGIVVTLREGSTPTHLRRVRAGRLEVAVVALDAEELAATTDLRVELLRRGGLLVAVPAEHRLAGRGSVRAEELEGEPWIVGAGGAGDPIFTTWPGLPGTPRVAFAVRDWPARLGLVAEGLGVSLLPAIAAGTIPDGVALVAVEDARPGGRDAYVATPAERSSAAEALASALRAAAATVGPAGA